MDRMQRSTSFSSRNIPMPPPAAGGGYSPNNGGRATLTNPAQVFRSKSNGGAAGKKGGAANGANSGRIVPTDLTFAEATQIRTVWTQSGKEYLRDVYSLRFLLGEIGLFPADDEMTEVLAIFENKISYNQFVRYVTYLKSCHIATVSAVNAKTDADTLRAFVALGGDENRTGEVRLDSLRDACNKFQLTIDVDAMVAAADVDISTGTVDFAQFKQMWVLGNAAAATAAGSPDAAGTSSPRKNNASGISPNNSSRRKHKNRQNSATASAADADLMHLLVSGTDGYSDDEFEGAEAVAEVYGDANTPRGGGADTNEMSLAPTTAAGAADSLLLASGGGLTAEKIAALRSFLLELDARRPQDDSNGGNGNNGPRRSNSLKRNMSRRFTTLPNIRQGNGILANAADAERAEYDEDGNLILSNNDVNANASQGNNTQNSPTAAGGVSSNSQQPEKQGYRAPSPMVLSEYTASRHRPEGNKLGLISPRGASTKGSSLGMTRHMGNTNSPTKKASSSPRRQK